MGSINSKQPIIPVDDFFQDKKQFDQDQDHEQENTKDEEINQLALKNMIIVHCKEKRSFHATHFPGFLSDFFSMLFLCKNKPV